MANGMTSGKIYQKRARGCESWHDIGPDATKVISDTWEYRVKPEVKYRPYTIEEAVRLLDGKKITNTKHDFFGYSTTVAKISSRGAEYGPTYYRHGAVDSGGWDPLEIIYFPLFIFADGTPCGVPVEEDSVAS